VVADTAPERKDETAQTTRQRALSDYLKPLSKHMLLIGLLVTLALVGGILVWALTFSTSPYEGEALVLFKPNANSQVDLSPSPQFRDITLDVTRQQQNAVLLMSSMAIAKEVQKQAATNSDSNIAALASKDSVAFHDSVKVQIQGNFISVKGQAPTAAAATWLANTWANVGIADVNKIYAEPSANVDEALQQAKTQLDTDQTAL